MMGQIKLLIKMELCNLYGFNVLRHTKDSKAKKKGIAMSVVIGAVLVMLMLYVVGLCYGLAMLGAANLIPAYLIVIASVIILFFGIFKAGGLIFRKKGYDIISSLPLSKWAVIFSRFLRLYVENLAIALLVMLPGLSVYAIFIRPAWSFYLIGLLSIGVIPLIPVAITTGIGTVITAISSRMKHKALVEAGISVFFVIAILLASSVLSENTAEITPEMMKNLTDMVTAVLRDVYPPAILLGNAMIQGSFLKLILGAVISIVIFAIVFVVVAMGFHTICRKLYSTSAKHDYQMERLQRKSVWKALVGREAKRYFSSGVYVTNTIIGPIMGIAFCIGLLFMDLEAITAAVPIPLNVNAAIPYAIAGIFTMMSTTSTSISMEGKEWWILKSLPLTTKNIFDGKILFNLLLMLPFYVVSEIIAMLALQPDIMEMVWLILVPALMILFSSVFGITANLLFPKFDWESEVTVVKQSASSAVGGFGVFLIAIICAFLVLLVPIHYKNLINLVLCIILMITTFFLYGKNNKADLKTI